MTRTAKGDRQMKNRLARGAIGVARHSSSAARLFIVAAILSLSAWAQPSNRQHASNFSSVEYFEPPYENQVKTRLSGGEAQPLAGGLLLVRQLKLENFSESGKLDSVVEAPECLYDRLNLTASSSGHIQLRTGDGKFRVDGDGFLFNQTNSFLTISNNVRTVIENAPAMTGAAAKK